jgi:DNA-directed RNA polymerase alpha subunit
MTSQGTICLQTHQFEKVNISLIDVVFMPINRVNYAMEVDEEIDSEKLDEHIFLEIWTNGSI